MAESGMRLSALPIATFRQDGHIRHLIAALLLVFLPFNVAFGQLASPTAAEEPGPSTALFNAPFYSCKRNFYIAPAGDDARDGSEASPWKTIQHADSASRMPGDCINVAAGTYQTKIVIRHGGNAPTSNGYVTYRCEVLDKCHVLAPEAGHLWLVESPANFVVVDGFELDGNVITSQPDGVADQCIGSSWDNSRYNSSPFNDSSHHIWVLNNIVHHCNLSGISFSNKEWIYVIHNKVYHNSWTSGYEGSGIGLVVIQCIEADNPSCSDATGGTPGTGTYQPSGMDLAFLPPFHNVVSWNVATDNSEAHSPIPCGEQTDGNGIIMDTFLAEPKNEIIYPYKSLVYGNVVNANGGRGIHVFAASNITVANNTAYHNGTNTCMKAFYLGDLSQAGGANNIWVNNVAQSIMTAANPACDHCGGRNAPLVAGNGRGVVDVNNSYLNNVLYGGAGPKLFDADVGYFLSTKNKITDPLFVSPSTGNLMLKPTSPAIGYVQPVPELWPTPTDAGACPPAVTICPSPLTADER